MRVEIEIPKEFEENFKRDQFEECLIRLNADAHEVAGRYESETAIMLINAFKGSKPAYDVNTVVKQLEKESYQEFCDSERIVNLKDAIEVVKGGGVDG